MATMTDRQSVAANTTIANALVGKTMEFVAEQRATVDLYATAAAVGMFYSLIIGSEIVVEDQEVNAQNRMPIIPDDFLARGGAFKGDRVVVKVRNSTAAPIIAFTRVEVNPA